ncbi:hypothetical protein QJS10_CPA01g01727 [Acorus calamus]|uniref:Uncharacterized protein n=1 Tax=Acorus calamus TaxID=4465 RepID=A0AAV9FMJ5_ACOCL|nr:hypothetical protein QJS10_CPA01g01727 [Acorus calamus]
MDKISLRIEGWKGSQLTMARSKMWAIYSSSYETTTSDMATVHKVANFYSKQDMGIPMSSALILPERIEELIDYISKIYNMDQQSRSSQQLVTLLQGCMDGLTTIQQTISEIRAYDLLSIARPKMKNECLDPKPFPKHSKPA